MIPHSTQNPSCAEAPQEESRCCIPILMTGSMFLPGALPERSAGFLTMRKLTLKRNPKSRQIPGCSAGSLGNNCIRACMSGVFLIKFPQNLHKRCGTEKRVSSQELMRGCGQCPVAVMEMNTHFS